MLAILVFTLEAEINLTVVIAAVGCLFGNRSGKVCGVLPYTWVPGHWSRASFGLGLRDGLATGPEPLLSSGVAPKIAFDSELQSLNQNYKELQRIGPGLTAVPARKGR
jgi:hypothetical protein